MRVRLKRMVETLCAKEKLRELVIDICAVKAQQRRFRAGIYICSARI